MKLLIGSLMVLTAFAAHAEGSLSEMKRMANDHMTQKMSSMQTAKSCIESAQTKEAFKACKYDMHEDMKMQKMEMMEHKKNKTEE